MDITNKKWQKLFLFCLGLFAAAAFCMKWMEGDFRQGGSLFTITGLEISYPKEKVFSILTGLDDHVKAILRYHLFFDFAFMAGVYPGITALCMMARKRILNHTLKKILFALAALQLVAWGCDIYENYCLLKWLQKPVIGDEFGLYHIVVSAKWIIAVTAALLSGIVFLATIKKKRA